MTNSNHFGNSVYYKKGDNISNKTLTDVYGDSLKIIPSKGFTHLQFRRFSGCPICNLHLRSFASQNEKLLEWKVNEIVIFHSPQQELSPFVNDLPFSIIADPEKKLYRQFGVESSWKSIFTPRILKAVLKGSIFSFWEMIFKGKPLPPIKPHGGSYGVPADFLISEEGEIIACKYGKHADDQWSVEELIGLIKKYRSNLQCTYIPS